MDLYDANSALVATTEFTMPCFVCGKTRQFTNGDEKSHDCEGASK